MLPFSKLGKNSSHVSTPSFSEPNLGFSLFLSVERTYGKQKRALSDQREDFKLVPYFKLPVEQEEEVSPFEKYIEELMEQRLTQLKVDDPAWSDDVQKIV